MVNIMKMFQASSNLFRSVCKDFYNFVYCVVYVNLCARERQFYKQPHMQSFSILHKKNVEEDHDMNFATLSVYILSSEINS